MPNTVIALDPIDHALGIVTYVGMSVGITLRIAGRILAEPPGWRMRVVAAAVPVAFFAMLYALAMGALGPIAITHVRWPLVFVLDHVTLDSTFFLSRIGILVVFSWTVGVATGLIVHVRMAQLSVGRWPRMARWISPTVVLCWFVADLIIPSPHTATELILRWVNPGATVYLVLEMLVLIASHIFARSKKAREPAAQPGGTVPETSES
ncbi:hypothetical protein [Sulfobacillus harzensis]|uniref:Uncharacterized protein n=1 Tax=Sulfobacillus harzensis TaxID=2729629 RepID=A0A7Y0Q5B1_9FIRM|nr:hypothetical protein [Sulfobacillus harzensis]NMP24094.1 hypothetical protein [Sulfobacillus harzensis]